MKSPKIEIKPVLDPHREQAIASRAYDLGYSSFEDLSDETSPAHWSWIEGSPEILMLQQLQIDVAREISQYSQSRSAIKTWPPLKERLMFMPAVNEAISMSLRTPEPQIGEDIEEVFNALVEEWRNATKYMSSTTDIILHPAHLQIIGLGPKAIPLLLRELQQRPYHFFWALSAITRENLEIPEGKGRVKRMTEAWLAWGRQRGHL